MANVPGRTPGRRVYRGRHVIVSFDMDRKGIAALAMGPELEAAVIHLAEHTAKPYAISLSPRSRENTEEHFQDSFDVVVGTRTIRQLRRVAAFLINGSPHAAAVEWGNSHTEAHRVLGRTLDHLRTLGHVHNPGPDPR